MPASVSTPVQRSRSPPDAASEAEAKPDFFDEDVSDDSDDTDPFNLSRACSEDDE